MKKYIAAVILCSLLITGCSDSVDDTDASVLKESNSAVNISSSETDNTITDNSTTDTESSVDNSNSGHKETEELQVPESQEYERKYLDGKVDNKLLGAWQDPMSDVEQYMYFDDTNDFYLISLLVPDIDKDITYNPDDGMISYTVETDEGKEQKIEVQVFNMKGEKPEKLVDGVYIPYGVLNESFVIKDNSLYEFIVPNYYYTINNNIITIHDTVSEAMDEDYDVTKEPMLKYEINEKEAAVMFSATDANDTETQGVWCARETRFDGQIDDMLKAVKIGNDNL